MTEPHANQISVVIPVRNEAGSIDQLLTSLLNQTLAPHEILITDGGSVDGTTDIVEHYVNQGAPVRLIKTAGALPGRGRNLSAAQAAGEWLAFIDGGNRPAPNWLAALAEQAQAAQADVVYGSYEPVIDSFFRECAAIAYVAAPQEIDGKLSRSNFIASTLMRREAWANGGRVPRAFAFGGRPALHAGGRGGQFQNYARAAGHSLLDDSTEPLAHFQEIRCLLARESACGFVS
jgi:glycosyltransferase involved in cell wall biosynthesis